MMTKIEDLEVLIKHHKAMYYQGRPEINDLDYDELENQLRARDPNNSILNIVGSTTTGNKVKHEKKMLSLNKTYSKDELEKWVEGSEVVSTLKIDGISCSIVYVNGNLTLGKTRGDGTYGEDITKKLMWLDSIPSKVNHKGKLEVRGELFCTEESFIKLSDEMVKIGNEKPTSQRNIVAGLISRKENIELCRYINFKAFDIISDTIDLKHEMDKEKKLSLLGFKPEEFKLHKKTDTILREIEQANVFMQEGSYQIDGIVFTYNDCLKHDELGDTAHHPRYKIAFKYQGDTKTTKINKIKWSVSRNGILTPVAEVVPVELSGAMISRVTLHNYGMVKQFNLKAGDEIEIVRSGEVIPKFLSVVKNGKEKFIIPEKCISCLHPTEIVDIRLMCLNENCEGKNLEQILNYIQKIGIDDLSSKRLEEMISKNLVSTIDDIYKLKHGDLLKLDKFKEKLEAKVLKNIEKSKSVELKTFLSALGIKGGALNRCEKVVDAGFETIDEILNLTEKKLINIDGFAERSASDFLKSLKGKRVLIENLIELGFSFTKKKKVKNGLLSGKKVAITGTLTDKRSNIEEKIKFAGGTIVSSVSKKTDILLTNQQNSSSSKFKKATELGIDVISEEDLNKMI